MTYTTLDLSVDAAVATVRLNRPDALNTMTPEFWEEMVTVFGEIESRSDIRCVVIASTGRHFTAGLDLKSFADLQSNPELDIGRQREAFRRKVKEMQESFSVIDRCRVPVIAVIQGGCIGGGVDLVTACDMRVMTDNAYFTIQEINIGIVADVGTLQRMPDQVPPAILRELAYTGRKFGAEEAARYGFVNAVADTHEAALETAYTLAKDIAAKSPLAMTGIKSVLNYSRDHSVASSLDYVATWNAAMLQGDDPEAAMRAVMTKQQATFKDLG
ncbi:MAG: crotonase/enoyl-CoA hydratase family protein [Sphingomonadales bacterium]|mgnify:CR=1 FL=1